MTKQLTILLFIGLAWGQADLDELALKDNIIGYQNLSIKEKAVKDATSDARKWLLYQPLIISLSGASSLFYFGATGHHPLESMPSMIISILSLYGSYSFFTLIDDNKIKGISPKDFGLYEKVYLKEYKNKKYKNIMISTGAVVLITGAVISHILSNLSFSSNWHLP